MSIKYSFESIVIYDFAFKLIRIWWTTTSVTRRKVWTSGKSTRRSKPAIFRCCVPHQTSTFLLAKPWSATCRLSSAFYIFHYSDVIMSIMASQITNPTIVYSTVYSGADQRKHQSSASLAVVRGIHRWPVNSPHKGPVTRKTFPFDDVIMLTLGVYLPHELTRVLNSA